MLSWQVFSLVFHGFEGIINLIIIIKIYRYGMCIFRQLLKFGFLKSAIYETKNISDSGYV